MKKFLVAFIVIFILSAAALVMAVNIRFPVRYMDIIEANAGELDPTWILAVIKAESSFRPNAESHRGAQGLMQLMPTTAEWVAEMMRMSDFTPERVWLPEVNIALGSYYLNWLLRYYNGNLNVALAAYNAGLGNVNRWLGDPQFSADGVNLSTIPFNETDNYLRRVMFNQRVYEIILWTRGVFSRRGS